ncbi:DUF6207 family protein [Streptomyces sp. NBC_00299]|uniref:DUF6207 family protein n=1 Tax=Streptomyces sp. NBC_00299 TaxID=2975705 RepID=UPI003FA7D57E
MDKLAETVQEAVNPPNASERLGAADRTTRDPGEPGVRLHCFLDWQQTPTQ